MSNMIGVWSGNHYYGDKTDANSTERADELKNLKNAVNGCVEKMSVAKESDDLIRKKLDASFDSILTVSTNKVSFQNLYF